MTISLRLITAAALLSMSTSACSSSSTDTGSSSGTSGTASNAGGGAVGSCTVQQGKTCFDYRGSAYTASGVQSSCGRINGTYAPDACATADRVGSCAISVGQATEQTVRYYSVDFTTQSATTNCVGQSGTFTAN